MNIYVVDNSFVSSDADRQGEFVLPKTLKINGNKLLFILDAEKGGIDLVEMFSVTGELLAVSDSATINSISFSQDAEIVPLI